MKTFVKITRKNEKSDNVTLKAIAVVTNVDREKLHHPELRPHIEDALKDFQLQLEEGEDVRFSRMMGQDVTLDDLNSFENNCIDVWTIINDLEIPTKEEAAIDEARQVVKSATDEEIELIKTLLKDFEESKVYGVNFVVGREDSIGHGRMTPELWKELLTSFMKIHGQL